MRGVCPQAVDKAQQIGGRDRGRAVVFERVIIERIVRAACPESSTGRDAVRARR